MARKFYGDVEIKNNLEIDGSLTLSAITANRALTSNGSGVITVSATTATELGYVSGVTSSIQTQLGNNATAISDHIADATDAHDASAISNIPSGNLAATDQQSVNNELQSDIDSRALDSAVIKKDGSVAFTADQSLGGFKIISLGAPTATSDAATKGYVDSVAEGLKPKTAARVATTANIVIATALNSGDSLDGVTLANGDRVLVKDQTAAEENGIYVVSATPTRSSDFDSLSPIDEINGALVAVQEGTVNAGKVFVQSGTVAVLNTDPISFVFFNSAASLVGGDGITVSGSNISVDHDGEGLAFVSTQLSIELDGSTLSKSASGLKLGDTAVTPGSYGSATQVAVVTMDQQGRTTSAVSTSIAIPASQVTDFNEAAQDAVGGILTDTASVDFTYNDGANTITAAVLPAGVDHDALANFVANEHIDHSGVTITGASNGGLAGGGDITTSRTLSVDITNATAETSADNADLVLIYDNSATALRKMTRANFLSGSSGSSPGDINETSFTMADNQAAAANITGFAFANAVVRSFSAHCSIVRDAASDLYEEYHIQGINKGSLWELSVDSVGDDAGITFSITNAGQVQYTSTALGTPVLNTFKFRAVVTGV